jgi:adenylate kinase
MTMGKVIVITGTPGVGKTTLAKYVAKRLQYSRFDLHKFYPEISTGYDKKKKCYTVDVKKLEKIVKREKSKSNLVIDSHIVHLLPKRLVNVCIVVVCSNLKKLQKRLKKRGYGKAKVRENLDAEIFQVCLQEAREQGHKVIVVDSGKMFRKRKLVKRLHKHL